MNIIRRLNSEQFYTLDLIKLILIGHSPENDIVIVDISVPDLVCKIEACDAGATSHRIVIIKPGIVRVNGKKTRKKILEYGDRIEIGSTILMIDRSDITVPANSRDAENILRRFVNFAGEVGNQRDLQKILQLMVETLVDIFHATDVLVFKLDCNGQPQVFASSSKNDAVTLFSDTIIQQVIKTGKGIVIASTLSDPNFSKTKSIIDLKLVSVLCAPIRMAARTTGVIYLGTKKATGSFTSDDLNVLSLYIILAGILLAQVEYINAQEVTIRRLSEIKDPVTLIGESPVIKKVVAAINTLADSDIPVLIEGETGTGKDVIANLIHQKSRRADRPFLVVNCSSLNSQLLESELFGHARGSFTGATHDHAGFFSAADTGTLFFDEIGELDQSLQSKLLRTLETGKIRSVGATAEETVDVRIICATNRNIAGMVKENVFRKDLYYRLDQFHIIVPPLRLRGNDVMLLAYYFLEKYRLQYPGRTAADFHPDSIKFLITYGWPGNVRELANMVHKAVLSAGGPQVVLDMVESEKPIETFETATKKFQKELMKKAVDAAGGNKEHAARLLGVHRSTLFRLLNEDVNPA